MQSLTRWCYCMKIYRFKNVFIDYDIAVQIWLCKYFLILQPTYIKEIYNKHATWLLRLLRVIVFWCVHLPRKQLCQIKRPIFFIILIFFIESIVLPWLYWPIPCNTFTPQLSRKWFSTNITYFRFFDGGIPRR